MAPANLHATAVLVADRCVLITGPAGSGKTALAWALVQQANLRARFARIVCDDQVFLRNCGTRLLCEAPPAISGMAEIRGIGPVPIAHEPKAVVDLVVRLVSREAAPRMAEGVEECLDGCSVARLDLPERSVIASTLAVCGWLGLLSGRGFAIDARPNAATGE